MSRDHRFFEVAERTILSDPGRRGVAPLARPGDLERACRRLADARRVGIVTGFYVPAAEACETDGPLGAAHLAKALRSNAEVVVCTDHWCLPVVRSILPDATEDPSKLGECDVLVSVERLGRAADGRYYSMRGEDRTKCTEPLDQPFLDFRNGPTIGVGDGGNEIGMGAVSAEVRRSVSLGDRIGSVVATDHLVVAGVSNWGAWAMTAGLGFLTESLLLPSVEQALADLKRLVDAGAVDGVSERNEATVDGLDWSIHAEILQRLQSL